MIITIGHRKGGCGKTPVVVNIALTLALQGHDVVIVDADPQKSASTWADDRFEFNPSLREIQCLSCTGPAIHSKLKDLDRRYEYVIVDAAGRDSQELRLSLAVSDLFIVPVTSDQTNINTLPFVTDTVREARELNPKLRSFAWVNMADTNPKLKYEIEDTKKAARLAFNKEIELLNSIVFFRKSWRDSMSEALGVMELKTDGGSKATKELNAMLAEVGLIKRNQQKVIDVLEIEDA